MRSSHRRAVAVAAIAIAAAASLAACGSSSSTEGSSAPAASEVASSPAASDDASPPADSSGPAAPDVCAAVPADQIATIIGGDPGAPTPGTGVCSYPESKLVLIAQPAGTFDQTAKTIATDPQTASSEDAAGVGVKALYFTAEDGSALVIADGGTYVVIVQAPKSKEELSNLANALLAALG